jgi:hypothetical protein
MKLQKLLPRLCCLSCLLVLLIAPRQPLFAQLTATHLPTIVYDAEMVVFRNELYFVGNRPPFGLALFKFDGTTVTAIPSPAGYRPRTRMPMEVFNNNLYMIMVDEEDDPTIPPDLYTLFRYDGATFTPITFPYNDRSLTPHNGDLAVYHNLLYIGTADTHLSRVDGWVTYDGTSTFTRVDFPAGFTHESWARMVVYHNRLYTLLTGTDHIRRLVSYDYDGSDFVVAPVADLADAPIGIIGDRLMLNQGPGFAGDHFVAFDGTTASTLPLPAATPTRSSKTYFNGQLYLRLGATRDEQLYAFNGRSYTHVPTNPGIFDGYDAEVYKCSLYFGLSIFDGPVTRPSLVALSYPLACSSFPLAGLVREFDFIDLHVYGRERNWCWNEIFIDWKVEPICFVPPLCPDPYPIQATLSENTKPIWSTLAKTPPLAGLPNVADKPYTFSLGIQNDNTLHDILQLDDSLIYAGVEELNFKITPAKQSFWLEVQTHKQRPVNLDVTLVDAFGRTLWQQQLTAPFKKDLKVKTPIAGTAFVIKADRKSCRPPRKDALDAIRFYPNPFRGVLTVDLTKVQNNTPVCVSIYDNRGNKILTETIRGSETETLVLQDKKPGLYLITFQNGRSSRRELIQLK